MIMIQIIRLVTEKFFNKLHVGIYIWIMNLNNRIEDIQILLIVSEYPYLIITFPEA